MDEGDAGCTTFFLVGGTACWFIVQVVKSVFENGFIETLNELFYSIPMALASIVFIFCLAAVGAAILYVLYVLLSMLPKSPMSSDPWEDSRENTFGKRYIKNYTKKDGTHVRGHYRKK